MAVESAYRAEDKATHRRLGGILLPVAFVATLPVFLLGMMELAESWTTPAYSHGPVVALMALWIGLRVLRDEPAELRAQPPTPVWAGLSLALAGLVIGAIGTLGKIGDVSAYGLILWIWGMVALTIGWARARRLWLAMLLLIFILPLPQFLYWELTTTLQHVSAVVGVEMIRVMGLAVYLDGNIIDLGVYRLQVAEACSGLQFLFPVISFALLFAAISRTPLWHKVVLVLVSAPLAVLMNSVRIALTALIVDRYGLESAEGFLHAFEGWTILLVCILVLAGFMLLLRLVSRRSARGRLFDLDTHGFGSVLARAQSLHAAPRLLTVAVAGGLVSALVMLPSDAGERPIRSQFAQFPIVLDDWRGLPNRLDPRVEAVIQPDDYVDMTYHSAQWDAPVHLFSSYYHDQTDGSALHSPEVCLPANGWEVIEFGTRQLDMVETGFGRFEANRAEIIKGTQRQLVYYWFEQRGARVTNDFVAKIDMLVDGVVRDRRDGALVRFVTPVRDGDIAAAEERVRALMRSVLPRLPDYIPS